MNIANQVTEKLDREILATPTSDLRSLLTDCSILIKHQQRQLAEIHQLSTEN